MNSSSKPGHDHNQFNTPYYEWSSYEYNDGHYDRLEEGAKGGTQDFKPSSKIPGNLQAGMENEEEEVYKDDFIYGFVHHHNHGSVDYTSVEDGHVHQCLDVTSPPRQLRDGTHIHYTEGYTLFEDGHHHYYKAWSGPGIPVGSGMHVHYYDFYTTANNGHRHRIRGVDIPAPGAK